MYSAALEPSVARSTAVGFAGSRPRSIIDPTWALAERHAERGTSAADQRQYFLGAGLVLGLAWSGLIALGAIAGSRLSTIDLEIVVPLCLVGLVGSSVRHAASHAAVIAAAGCRARDLDMAGRNRAPRRHRRWSRSRVGSGCQARAATTWLAILLVGLASFAFRVVPLALLPKITASAGLDRFVRHAGTAAVTALIALSARRSAAGGHALPALLAIAVALWLAVRGHSRIRLLLAGGGVYVITLVILAHLV